MEQCPHAQLAGSTRRQGRLVRRRDLGRARNRPPARIPGDFRKIEIGI